VKYHVSKREKEEATSASVRCDKRYGERFFLRKRSTRRDIVFSSQGPKKGKRTGSRKRQAPVG